MSDISGRMADQVLDEDSLRLDFQLYLGLCLFEDAPLGEVGIDDSDIVVLVDVVDFHLC